MATLVNAPHFDHDIKAASPARRISLIIHCCIVLVNRRTPLLVLCKSSSNSTIDTMTDTLSAREMEVLALAWQCFETEPKVRSHLPVSRRRCKLTMLRST
jgi:hypothetical protein